MGGNSGRRFGYTRIVLKKHTEAIRVKKGHLTDFNSQFESSSTQSFLFFDQTAFTVMLSYRHIVLTTVI